MNACSTKMVALNHDSKKDTWRRSPRSCVRRMDPVNGTGVDIVVTVSLLGIAQIASLVSLDFQTMVGTKYSKANRRTMRPL